ncbi:Sensor histidine kinase TmoS [Rubripirellula obstinata]|uniref:histidine kinase n=1 Tax=Rubripirellula obstinata TaxID=406547 RepID=A0A5B1CKA4_9BACT|nr:ATP-binding protein [Rubripirellula obstinata]KAA1260741.1 Sensor histidine kinase TmoS [Rubripirellula obstinata]
MTTLKESTFVERSLLDQSSFAAGLELEKAEAVKLRCAENERSLRKKLSTFGLAIGVLMMPMGAGLDYVLYPDSIFVLWAIRLVTTLVLGCGLFLFWKHDLGDWVQPLSVALVLIPSLAIALMIYLTDGADSKYYFGLILLMIVVHLLAFTFTESLTYCLVVLVSYAAAVMLNDSFSAANYSSLFAGMFFLFTSGVVCVVICHLGRQNRMKAITLQLQLEQQAQERLDFLADVSHELRTPLTLIAGPLDEILAAPGQLRQSVGESLGIMRRNVSRLRLLVDDVLDVVRQRGEILTLQQEEIDVREFLQQVMSLMEGAAKEQSIKLHLEGETSPVEIVGDPIRLERVISNLIGNAIKFSPKPGEITVRLHKDAEHAVIEVLDEGPGIPEDETTKVFDRMFQAENVQKEQTARGLGLGLAIAKKIVLWHGGQIDVRNRETGGAIFRVRLPLDPSLASDSSATHHRRPSKSSVVAKSRASTENPLQFLPDAPTQASNMSSGKIHGNVLIIDDEPEICSYLKDCLKRNHHVETASNANQGIAKAVESPPDCILLDYMLPDVKDFSALRQLRNEPRLVDTRILMLTANADETIKLAALRQGADDFLSKPFGVAELIARVDGLVNSSQTHRALIAEKAALSKSMEELQQAELKLLQSEKMRTLADLSAGLLHEIQNPVHYSSMAISVLKRRDDLDEMARDTINDISDGVTRIGSIVDDLRSFAHPETQGAYQPVDVREVAKTAKRFSVGELDSVLFEIEEQGPLEEKVDGSKSQLVQLVLNLIVNAVNAMNGSDEARIRIAGERIGDRLRVAISDNGKGMTDQQLERVGEPFFTNSEGGLGLGIPICKTIVENHGGKLLFESELGEGTTVYFDLGLAAASPESASPQSTSPESTSPELKKPFASELT